MKELIEQLARDRAVEAEYEQEIADLEALLAKTTAGKRLANIKRILLRAAKADVESTTRAVHKAALAKYRDTIGGKHPHPAVTIKLYTVLEYAPDQALEYARQHLPQAVKLDKCVFERFAKVVTPGFVTKAKEPRATIARDLSAYVRHEVAEEDVPFRS